MNSLLIFALLSAIAAVLARRPVGELSPTAEDDQYDFLVEFYNSTSGDMWVNNTNWLVRNETVNLCNWHGVSCAGKWVEKLALSKNGLGGPLPGGWERLPYVVSVDLTTNKLVGTIPPSIGNMTLNALFLADNSLKGTLPSTLGDLNVQMLFLGVNHFSGTLPAALAKNPLQELTLDGNHFTGTIPEEFGDIGAQFMSLSGTFNDFTGTLPVGLCQSSFCDFSYNNNLGCPSPTCKCHVPRCNCGKICSTNTDCDGGSCPSCSKSQWGYSTCGGQ